MKKRIAPKARLRSQAGILPLDWRIEPASNEMWPDKIDILLFGHIEWPDGVSFHDYLLSIAGHPAIKGKPTVGRRFRSDVSFGSVNGEMNIAMVNGNRADVALAGQAKIVLSLFLNPTRTHALAVRRNPKSLHELSLREFFKPIMQADEAFREIKGFADGDALDGSDNLFWNAKEAGGTTSSARAKARDEFLVLYETRLRDLITVMLTPTPAPRDGEGEHENLQNGVHLTIPWSDLRVRYAEIYLERSTEDPVATMHVLHDRGLSLARSIRASSYSRANTAFIYEKKEGFSHVVVPLTRRSNIDLSVYAKTRLRLRFEVRYRREFTRIVKDAPANDTRLSCSLALLIDDAATRLPWRALRAAMRQPVDHGSDQVFKLIIAIQSATEKNPKIFPDLLRSLILTGGVNSDDEKLPGINSAITKLAKRGILEHWQTQKKEARAGRRYGLTQEYFCCRLILSAGNNHPASINDRAEVVTNASNSVDQQEDKPNKPLGIRPHARSMRELAREHAVFRRNRILD
jgi:hypothetical protein